ncbi:hypothetical protein FOCG_09700 [Fusarium oxysporum f. sp. radicis-lycopersici 26381]|uniref:Uncharacterized protein n=3 Tax=Fusarium oxysporum TaxID=5507 RepID=A0A0J9U4C3_FUSO4|nr:hypothetical protein FOXG_17838 [Fusarium oxysporum f. sp. lycopersici 4287]XP_018232015.1 hypothetical protein FOXG_17838 [Fusarium oxysporum f. sp. lycopersici 4287]XP_018232016.1 hypothetical protein FOXG_17838 [Fusarium oxysporum f. sp. lycopersici 4287]XP_018232017.1 hypothetical protein FOXG_17838 [Fusarium oxysporum f. sp. lycopersici 4287]XP_018232018.1 hypothetical protein FOXG_17838 [Fusarium oxysporum f. sp. lycopersici 4287]XP_018232019.1 hypothetical protein FOXG_17838 [Fusariu
MHVVGSRLAAGGWRLADMSECCVAESNSLLKVYRTWNAIQLWSYFRTWTGTVYVSWFSYGLAFLPSFVKLFHPWTWNLPSSEKSERRLVDRREILQMMPTAQVLRNDQLLLQGFSGI